MREAESARAYVKFQVHERPTLGLALWLETPDGGQSFTAARVAIGCVCPFPCRVPAAEEMLTGSRSEIEKRLADAAEAIADSADLVDDHEGSIDYKRHLIGVFLRRAVFFEHWGKSIEPGRLNRPARRSHCRSKISSERDTKIAIDLLAAGDRYLPQ